MSFEIHSLNWPSRTLNILHSFSQTKIRFIIIVKNNPNHTIYKVRWQLSMKWAVGWSSEETELVFKKVVANVYSGLQKQTKIIDVPEMVSRLGQTLRSTERFKFTNPFLLSIASLSKYTLTSHLLFTPWVWKCADIIVQLSLPLSRNPQVWAMSEVKANSTLMRTNLCRTLPLARRLFGPHCRCWLFWKRQPFSSAFPFFQVYIFWQLQLNVAPPPFQTALLFGVTKPGHKRRSRGEKQRTFARSNNTK